MPVCMCMQAEGYTLENLWKLQQCGNLHMLMYGHDGRPMFTENK